LALNIPLGSQDTLLKYISVLHSYMCHTIILFIPTNLDKVCVQATHLESRGKNVKSDFTKKQPSKFTEGKFKGREKGKKAVTVKKDEAKPTCSQCKKEGHNDVHYWKLHPKLRTKIFGGKGNPKTISIVKQDFRSDLGDETNIIVAGVQGKTSYHDSTSSSIHPPNSEKRRSGFFHLRVITKHTKVDTLFYIGSQVNMISEAIVKKLGLKTKPHKKPYPPGWVCDDAKVQVTR
jgi:hypothetical protein